MAKSTFILLLLSICFTTAVAQNKVVYRLDELEENPPTTFSEDNYESSSFILGGDENNQRLKDEVSNLSYALTRHYRNFNFRPTDLEVDVTLSINFYFTKEGAIEYVIYNAFKYETKDNKLSQTNYRFDEAIDNKFKLIFKEFAKIYTSSYRSLRPFVVRTNFNLRKQAKNTSKKYISTLEEATRNAEPDTVKKLNFSGLGLTTVPEVIYRFKNLESLELSNNYLTKIPAELTKLKKIAYLGLNFNELNEESIEFKRNKSLKVLKLQHNPLATIPTSLKKNRRLEDLFIGNNRLKKLNESSFKGLNKLKSMNLYNCQIDTLPDAFARLKRLEILDLYHNYLRVVPPSILKLKNLHTLAVSHNQLWKLPDDLAKLSKLEVLYVHYNKLSKLPDLPLSLTLLHFSNNRFSEFPMGISALYQLETIDFSSNNITETPNELLALPKLKFVFMMGNEYNRREELFDNVERFVVDLESKSIKVR